MLTVVVSLLLSCVRFHRSKLKSDMEMRAKRQRLQAWSLVALQSSWHKRHAVALHSKQQQRRLQRRFASWRHLIMMKNVSRTGTPRDGMPDSDALPAENEMEGGAVRGAVEGLVAELLLVHVA